MITSAQKIRSMNGLSMRQCERNNRNEGVFIKEYRTEEIVSYIKEHKEHSKIGILLSGDTGFYSGAKKLKERLTEVCSDQIKIYPGISSLSYLASKAGVSWEDAKILYRRFTDIQRPFCFSEEKTRGVISMRRY